MKAKNKKSEFLPDGDKIDIFCEVGSNGTLFFHDCGETLRWAKTVSNNIEENVSNIIKTECEKENCDYRNGIIFVQDCKERDPVEVLIKIIQKISKIVYPWN